MEEAQVRGGGLARAGPSGSATGGGRGRQRSRSAQAVGRGAGHTLSSVNAAELRELTATVFKTILSPARSQWQRQWQRQGSSFTKQRAPSRTDPRQNAQRLTNSSVPVRARMGGVSVQPGGNERVCAGGRVDNEDLLGGQRGEERASSAASACAALSGEAVQEGRGQRGVDAHRVLPPPGHPLPRGNPGSSAAAAEGSEEARPGRQEELSTAKSRGSWHRCGRSRAPRPPNGGTKGCRRTKEPWLLLMCHRRVFRQRGRQLHS